MSYKRLSEIIIDKLNLKVDLPDEGLDSWVLDADDCDKGFNNLGFCNEDNFINTIEYVGEKYNIPVINFETIKKDCTYLEALEYCQNNLKEVIQYLTFPKNNPSLGHQIYIFLFRWLNLNKDNMDIFLFNQIDLGLNNDWQFILNNYIRNIVGNKKQVIYYTHSYEICDSLVPSVVISVSDWKYF